MASAGAYYNENDRKTAAWLRELIKAKLIADGEVDTRSITEVQPADLTGFTQCHFFAGIGGWSYALRLAGWPEDRAVWTGSCPCQPFSSAGAQAGGHDPRDLWPAWFKLIAQCRPVVVFGEQVEAAIGHGWLDRLCDDLEAEDYAIGPVGLPGASVGAFHIRNRLWFVAESDSGYQLRTSARRAEGTPAGDERWGREVQAHGRGASGILADSESEGRQRLPAQGRSSVPDGPGSREVGDVADSTRRGFGIGGSAPRQAGYVSERVPVGDERCGCWDRNAFHRTAGMLPGEVCVNKGALDDSQQQRAERSAGSEGRQERTASSGREDEGRRLLQALHASAVDWRACEWIPCTDGKARPIEPGTFPLAHGLPARVGRLRGYGNAIVPQVAAEFIKAYREVLGEDVY